MTLLSTGKFDQRDDCKFGKTEVFVFLCVCVCVCVHAQTQVPQVTYGCAYILVNQQTQLGQLHNFCPAQNWDFTTVIITLSK